MPNIRSGRPRHTRQSLPLQGLFFILLLICGIYALLNSSFFSVSRIIVDGNKQLKTQEIVNLSGITVGTNTFKLKIDEIEKRILLHPLVKKVTVKRLLPGKIKIDLEERVGQGLLPKDGGFYVVDSEGVFLYPVDSIEKINLPIITGVRFGKIKTGQKIKSEGLRSALDYLAIMPPEISTIVSEINCANPENIIMYTIDGVEVRLGNTENATEKLEIYRQVASQKFQQKIQYIDLSYHSKPVVKFYSKPE
ncbi:Polypeptide-transport-associated domain protein FtsQ-type [Thermincola potens JR]|uniref:Polypeptide-transport-associated domain protein FtsQ-type n=1 Tax=Thermincola potens (strain JR) TaxID=635013 RepID=D5X997_THEPJ|nr:Polypeptide-transport-associated domain protein FtsQ-type [Thermincola potens JR]